MNKSETIKIISAMKAMYPQSYGKLTNEELSMAVGMWQTILEDYSYNSVSAGLKSYALTHSTPFAPSIGELVEEIRRLEDHPDTKASASEMWSLVLKAARDSTYHSEERFAELPSLVQKCVGSPANLKEMAMSEADVVGSVQKSLFVKAYNAELERAKTEQKTPDELRRVALAEQQKRAELEQKTANLLKVVK